MVRLFLCMKVGSLKDKENCLIADVLISDLNGKWYLKLGG